MWNMIENEKNVMFFSHFPNVQSNKDNVCWHDLWLLGTFNLMRRSPRCVSENMSAEICKNGKFWWDYLPNPCQGGFSIILSLSGQIIRTKSFKKPNICSLKRLKFLARCKESYGNLSKKAWNFPHFFWQIS